MSTLTFLSIALLAALSTAQLVVYSAGRKPQEGPQLTDGSVICPDDYRRGFSIRCMETEASTVAKFFINGKKVRKDKTKPFYFFGNKANGKVRKWQTDRFSGDLTIRCQLNDGTTTQLDITISCETEPSMPPAGPSSTPTASPSPSMPMVPSGEDVPGSMLLHPTGDVNLPGTPIMDGMTFCPTTLFASGKFTVKCVESDTSTSSRFFVDGVQVKFEGKKPYFIAGDKGGIANPWTSAPTDEEFELRCLLSDGAESTVKMTVACDEEVPATVEPGVDVITTESGCVVIDIKSTELSPNWTPVSDGLTFRKDQEVTFIAPAGKFPLEYEFIAPLDTQYGFVVEMTSKDPTEFNDFWANFPSGGFQLMRGGIVNPDEPGTGYIKVYHNANGRAAISTSVDFNAHSLATRDVLQKGQKYKILLSGRSAQVTLHKIFMFPCDANKCQRASTFWKKRLASCMALVAM